MSSISQVLRIATNPDHLLNPLTKESGIAEIVLTVFLFNNF